MLLKRLRKICLALPETTEVEAWGHPTFRVRNKIFVGCDIEGSRGTMGVKVSKELQAMLVESDPRFRVADYVGKHGWVSMTLEGRVDWAEIEHLVHISYRLIAPAKLARLVEPEDA